MAAAFQQYRFTQSLNPPTQARSCRIQFSPDGAILAVGFNRTVYTYFLTPHHTLSAWNDFKCYVDRIIDLSFSHDSKSLAVSGADSVICIHDVSTGSVLRTLVGHESAVLCAKFHPRSMVVASGSFDDTIRIWDAGSAECLKVLPAGLGGVSTMDFSTDGSLIVAGSVQGGCRVWDTATGNMMVEIKKQGMPKVGSVKFSSDGMFVLIGFMDSSLMIWSTMEGGLIPTRYSGHENTRAAIRSTFIRADERYIASGSEDNCLYIWEVMRSMPVQKIDQAHTAAVKIVTSHPSRNVLASVSSRDMDIVKVWAQNP